MQRNTPYPLTPRHHGQQGPEQEQDRIAQQDGQQAVGKDLLFAVALVQAEPDDGVAHPHGHQRNQKVGALAQQFGDAHALHVPHGVGQEGLDN